MSRLAKAFTFLMLALQSTPEYANAKNLIFLDNSVANDTYIPSNKERQISTAFEMAVEEIKLKFPTCKLSSSKMIDRSSLTNVMKQVAEIKGKYIPSETMIVGLIHSSEALLAAKSFAKTDFLFVSSGATSEDLIASNLNLFSLANPTSAFVGQIINFLQHKKVKKISILIPGNSSYAFEFGGLTRQAAEKLNVDVHEFVVDTANPSASLKSDLSRILSSEAIFVPGFVQQSLPIVAVLQNNRYDKPIIGTPNWGRSLQDFNALVDQLHANRSNLFFPISWKAGESRSSTQFEKRFNDRSHEQPMGTAVYTYDAAILAGEFLCSSKKVTNESFTKFLASKKPKNLKTARNYITLQRNHLTSKISFINAAVDFKKAKR